MGCSLTTAENPHLFLPKYAVTGEGNSAAFHYNDPTAHFCYSQLLWCTEACINTVILTQE